VKAYTYLILVQESRDFMNTGQNSVGWLIQVNSSRDRCLAHNDNVPRT
jgi:hypothetical protein